MQMRNVAVFVKPCGCVSGASVIAYLDLDSVSEALESGEHIEGRVGPVTVPAKCETHK